MPSFNSLTSLKLTITALKWPFSDEFVDGPAALRRDYLKNFLRGLSQLRSLHLNFEQKGWATDPGEVREAPANLRNTFSRGHQWPNLRKLSLQNMNTPEDELLFLLTNHSRTLKDLRLRELCFTPEGDWLQFFVKVRETSSLTSARFEGFFFNSEIFVDWDEDVAWHMDRGGKDAMLAKYLVHGGECPLTYENTHCAEIGSDWEERIYKSTPEFTLSGSMEPTEDEVMRTRSRSPTEPSPT
ncbi:hypothetical protein BDV96DRAFT_199386 [Lophiotrema nucula]|uniref:Uncharacterized protein n=1 Tax=Lophiotrema nucula TaxID=690887 RepID=A0A6A5YUG1_9PLEO|nr:hypothetical protein BDV96DRAFT_199386 [Lophiotrema nucula]